MDKPIEILSDQQVDEVEGGILFALVLLAPELSAIALGAAIYIAADYING
nr:hypothetical protein [uncultured Sphingomonas sp.]